MNFKNLSWRCIALTLGAVCILSGGQALAADYLVPGGIALGIQMNIDGVLVADTGAVEGLSGEISPAADAGIEPGDLITALDGHSVTTAAELAETAKNLSDTAVDVAVLRDGEELHFSVCPAVSEEGARLGLWLRDGIAGIGTMTYYDPESGRFGALGHGVCETEGKSALPMSGGSVSPARVVDVTAGSAGVPGALSGIFDAETPLGVIERNTDCGIFGQIRLSGTDWGEALPVAEDSEICAGEASILCSVSDRGVESYRVEISRPLAGRQGRMLNVHVTDEGLLALTGGIVQGMSGSPIVQNGKLVGAVTHVLVSDPSRGYGITIESMLCASAEELETAA